MSLVYDDPSPPATRADQPPEERSDRAEPWRIHARILADWCDQRLVNRRDAWGGYYKDPTGLTRQTTQKATDPRKGRPRGPLGLDRLTEHFAADRTDAIVGLHSTFCDEAGESWSRWLAIDIDRHGDDGDADRNLDAALAIVEELEGLGFKPLLFDSNGRGGFHVLVVFNAPVSTRLVFAFARWLVRNCEEPPETFPKQPGIAPGKYGNWLRLPGRHHTRDHHTRVLGGHGWLSGAEAIRAIVATTGDPESLIPQEACPDSSAPVEPGGKIHQKGACGDGATRAEAARPKAEDGTVEPGADYNLKADWGDVVGPHGWRLDHGTEGTNFWTRPGKDRGVSATTNHNGNDTLYVFTDATVFVQHGSYTKFGAYAVLNHGGDFKASARALSAEGYGTYATWVERDGNWAKEVRPNPCPRGTRLAKSGDGPPGGADGSGGTGRGDDPGDRGRAGALDETLSKRPRTDLGNAERLVARHGPDLRYCHPWGRWLVWDAKRWKTDDTGEVRRRARRTARLILAEAAAIDDDEKRKLHGAWALTTETRDRLSAMLSLAEAEEGVPILPANMDTDPWLFNCRNGTVDLRTGQLRPHRREDLITKLCDIDYDPDATCPLWLSTLDTFLAREDPRQQKALVDYWQRLCGYALTGVVRDHAMPVAYGTGSNGKSTILGTMIDVFGPDYAMKCPPDLLMAKKGDSHPTDRADMFGKRLVVAIETENGRRLNENLIKELTGGDVIRARRMREDFWEFRPSHTMFLATNHKPVIRGTDRGIWRRLKLVPFTVAIDDDRADKAMPEKLRAEYAGILAWCVRGCLAWAVNGLDSPAEVKEATDSYRRDQDVIGAFLEERTVLHPSVRVKASELYRNYTEWASNSGEHATSLRAFGTAIEERGIEKKTSNGVWYVGVGLRVMDDAESTYGNKSGDGRSGGGTDFGRVGTLGSEFDHERGSPYTRSELTPNSLPSVPTLPNPLLDGFREDEI